MEIIKTPLAGLLIIKPDVFEDERGYFFESYNYEKFLAVGLDLKFMQDNPAALRMKEERNKLSLTFKEVSSIEEAIKRMELIQLI